MKPQYSLTTLFLLSLLFLSTLSFAQKDQYELVLTDSILVESLEQIQITDYSPEKDRFLVFGTMTKKCLEIDRKGKIISEVDLTGEGPGHFGRGITELGYLGNDMIINGPNVYFSYDENWNYKERIVYTSGGAWLPNGMISGAPEAFVINNEPQIFKSIDHSYFGTRKLPSDYFSTASLIEVISKSGEDSENKLKYPKVSLYQSQTTFYSQHNAILSYNSTNKKLYLALPLEPKIYVYNLDDYNLINTIDLDLISFKEPQGIPFDDQHKNGRRGFGSTNQLNTVYSYTNSSIYGLSSEGKITIVEYKTGTEGKTNLRDIQEASKLSKKESRNFTAFYKEGSKVAEIEKRFTRLVRINEYSFLAHEVNNEEEIDYSKFYIYELKKAH